MSTYTEWSDELADALAEPFAPGAHSEKRQGGSSITFVDVHEYKERLNATVGPHGWTSAVRMEAYGGKLIVVVALSILGVTKENVGDEVEEAPTNERGNSKLIGTPITNAYAQAFKRTCADFGLGAYLYDKEGREAAVRGQATPRQMDRLHELLGADVFSGEERDRVAAKVAGMGAQRVAGAIRWAHEQIRIRAQTAGAA